MYKYYKTDKKTGKNYYKTLHFLYVVDSRKVFISFWVCKPDQDSR